MKEEDIRLYILKKKKKNKIPILQAILFHDNCNLNKLKENLKKYEFIKFRIHSKDSGFVE